MTLKWGSVLTLCVTEFFHSKASQYEVNVECGSHRAVLYVVAKSLGEQHLELACISCMFTAAQIFERT